MDTLRCVDFPCDFSNCGIMELGAKWPSAEGQKCKAPSSLLSSSLSSYRIERRLRKQGIVGMISVLLKVHICTWLCH